MVGARRLGSISTGWHGLPDRRLHVDEATPTTDALGAGGAVPHRHRLGSDSTLRP